MDFAKAFETLNKLNESNTTDEVVKLIQEIEVLEQEIEDFETQVRLDWNNNYSKRLDTKRAEYRQLRSELAAIVSTYRKWFYTTDCYGETEKDFEDDSVKKAEVEEQEKNLEAKIKQCEKELDDLEAQLKAEQKQALSKEYQANQDRKSTLDSKKALKKTSKAAVLDTEREELETLLSKLNSELTVYHPGISLTKIEPIWKSFKITASNLYLEFACIFSKEVNFADFDRDSDIEDEFLKDFDADFFEELFSDIVYILAPEELADEVIEEYLDFSNYAPFGGSGWELDLDPENVNVQLLEDISEDLPEADVECVIGLFKDL